MSNSIRPRQGGEVTIERTLDGLRLTVLDREGDEIADVYLTSSEVRRLGEALGLTTPPGSPSSTEAGDPS